MSRPPRQTMRLRSSGPCLEDHLNNDDLNKSTISNLNEAQKTNKRIPLTKRSNHKSKLQKNNINASEQDNDIDQNPSKELKSSKEQSNTRKNSKINSTQVITKEIINENNNLPNKTAVEDNIEEEVVKTKTTKYQNARSVLNGCVVDKLPGRDKQLAELKLILKDHIETGRSGSLYVSGQPGTGKTACLSLILRDNELRNRVESVYINCTEISSTMAIYKKLYNELNISKYYEKDKNHQRLTGNRDYMKILQDYLYNKTKQRKNKMLLLVFDEIDHLCSSNQSVLYTIFEWPSLNGVHLLLIGIANSLDLTERILKRLNIRNDIKPLHIHFPPYNKQEILDIFWTRLKDANVLDVFNPVTLQLLAAKVSAISGDVRRALNIGRRTIEIAEQQNKFTNQKLLEEKIKNIDNQIDMNEETKEDLNHTEEKMVPVQINQVTTVLNNVYGASQYLQNDIAEDSFPLQQKIILCTLMLILRNDRNKSITNGRLFDVYRRICSSQRIQPLDEIEFDNLLDLLQTRGILNVTKQKKGFRLNRVALLWDEEEVNAALYDKQLIASILNDTKSLTK